MLIRLRKKKDKGAAMHKPTREELEDFLTGRHCVLWGRHFDLSRKDTKAAAVDWLAAVLDELESSYSADS